MIPLDHAQSDNLRMCIGLKSIDFLAVYPYLIISFSVGNKITTITKSALQLCYGDYIRISIRVLISLNKVLMTPFNVLFLTI